MGDPVDAPDAPWHLSGEWIVGVARGRPDVDAAEASGLIDAGRLPAGIRSLPGPVVVGAARYTASPVGPYLELVVAQPARIGLRPGFCLTTCVVSSAASRIGGRRSWGIPKLLGDLEWHAEGDRREMRWADRGIVLRGSVRGPAVPAVGALRLLQRRADGPVVVPWRLAGFLHPSWVHLEAPPDDALAPLAGRHPGAAVAGVSLVVRPARVPSGLAATLGAPLRAPEPAGP